jgi:uncharacterized membrane protein YhaH (DUF805 family)
MNASGRWSRVLLIVGLLCMLIGAVDPLEGSFVILPGIGMVAIGALLGKSRYRKLLYRSFVLVAVGVGALVVLSALGGIRLSSKDAGHSMWWGLFLLPYPVGWIMGLVGAILSLTKSSKRPEQ